MTRRAPVRGMDALARIPVRLALGGTMLYHGLAKLRGEGPDQTGAFFESLGIRPGRTWAIAAGVAETFAGAAALLGIATRPAALAILATQGLATMKVHRGKGFDNAKGGFEFNLALMSMALGLLVAGPGPISAEGAARTALRRRNARSLGGWSLPLPARTTRVERGLDLLH